jgi:hypothetical protein
MTRSPHPVLLAVTLGLGLLPLACGSATGEVGARIDPLHVEGRSPENGATDVGWLVRPRIWFDREIEPETVTTETAGLAGPDGPVPCSLRVLEHEGEPACLIELTPDEPLEPDTEYRILITQGVEDTYENTLAAPFASQFWTTPRIAGDRSWAEPFTFAEHPEDGRYPALAMDDEGTALVAWMAEGETQVDQWRRVYTPGTGWGEGERWGIDARVVEPPSVAMNGQGYGLVAAADAGGYLGVGHRITISPFDPTAGWGAARHGGEGSEPIRYPCAAVDGDGNGYAAWETLEVGNTQRSIGLMRYYLSTPAGVEDTVFWRNTPVPLGEDPDNVRHPRLAVNASGAAFVLSEYESSPSMGPGWTRLRNRYFTWPESGYQGSGGAEVNYYWDRPWPPLDSALALDENGRALILTDTMWDEEAELTAEWWSREGTTTGPESSANLSAHLGGAYAKPHATIARDGRTLVVWEQELPSGDHAIVCRWYTEAAGWYDEATLITSHRHQANPYAAIGPLGEAIVIWHDYDIQVSHHQGGTSWSAPQVISTFFSTEDASRPRVAIDMHGRALAVWQQYEYSPPRWTVRAARFE